jgi:anti-anti-sigma factor
MDAPDRHIACQPQEGLLLVTLLDDQVQGEQVPIALRRELLAALPRFGLKKWIIDFGKVTFFSSAGLAPLLSLHRKLQEVGGRMIFCNLHREVLDMFLATRLLSATGSSSAPFEAAQDLAEAQARLRHHVQRMVDGILVFTFTDPELIGEELAEELAEEIQAAIRPLRAPRVILDFNRVLAITTPCMRPLLNLRSAMKEKGGRAVFACVAPQLAEILAITRLIPPDASTPGLFQVFPDVETALQALR